MTTEKWHADIHVTDELAINCIQEQFPELLPIEIKSIGEGWDNKIFLVNEEIIFRFPRRKIAVELIERENALLKNLQPLFAIRIPNPVYIGKPTSSYPYPFHGYKIIPGLSGCHAHLTDEARLASLPVLAKFLRQLHNIDEAQAISLGAENQIFDRTVINEAITDLKERVNKITTKKICAIDMDCFEQEMQIANKIKLPEDKCLVHGDLYCRHLMFDKNNLVGIIDWGDVGINNRSVDLSVIWSFYPQSVHGQFFKLYGEVDANTWQYARFLGLYSAFTLILYGTDTKDVLLVTEAINAIKMINPALLNESYI